LEQSLKNKAIKQTMFQANRATRMVARHEGKRKGVVVKKVRVIYTSFVGIPLKVKEVYGMNYKGEVCSMPKEKPKLSQLLWS
jgi:hypothetical protein